MAGKARQIAEVVNEVKLENANQAEIIPDTRRTITNNDGQSLQSSTISFPAANSNNSVSWSLGQQANAAWQAHGNPAAPAGCASDVRRHRRSPQGLKTDWR